MIDVTEKAETVREAVAAGRVVMKARTLSLIKEGKIVKGDVLAAAQVAGILAAKRTWELIPLCHPLPLTDVALSFALDEVANFVDIQAKVRCVGRTGVEMEALVAVSVAALTIYDMCKGADRGMTVESIRLLRKSGGRSGTYEAPAGARGR
ncbi:MAG: cyclic pyranopterin monophosphate synthase MoaC [Chloroflexi bacterium]|nr:cyclic pyranopterin monophosphate synthase MoaC [Chloroflexota bacterium]